MKLLETYKKLNLNTEDEVFGYFIKNLRKSNRTFDFFVDWDKVFRNVKKIEMSLNLLNYLIGKENIKEDFKELIKEYPDVVSTIPVLIAIRQKNIEVLADYKDGDWVYKNYNFRKKKKYNDEEINLIVEFCDRIMILDLLKNKKIKNLVDYMIGLEVGIGTNGRKNRSGSIMEDIIEWYINIACLDNNLEYISQGTKRKIKKKWNIDLPIDKSSRSYDFVIKKKEKLILIETNYYSGGGSKLKSVAGEFKSLDNYLKDKDIIDSFLWITDGLGWITAKNPLRETFINNDYVINTKLIDEGALDEILTCR